MPAPFIRIRYAIGARADRASGLEQTEMISIRKERPPDVAAREALLDQAFGKNRRRKRSQRLRDGRLRAVARDRTSNPVPRSRRFSCLNSNKKTWTPGSFRSVSIPFALRRGYDDISGGR